MLRQALAKLLKPQTRLNLSTGKSISWQRKFMETSAKPLWAASAARKKVRFDSEEIAGVMCDVIQPKKAAPTATLVYLHGGGYNIGSPAAYRELLARIAWSGELKVIAPDYRLAPEHPWPAAPDDALAIWNAIADKETLLAGDSAGGGLSVTLTQRIIRSGGILPTKIWLISPLVDLTLSLPAVSLRGKRDPILTKSILTLWNDNYLGGTSLDKADELKPLDNDLSAFPATLIHVGSEEILRDDAHAIHKHLWRWGASSELKEYPGLWHDFHMYGPLLKTSRAAVNEAVGWLKA